MLNLNGNSFFSIILKLDFCFCANIKYLGLFLLLSTVSKKFGIITKEGVQ